MNIQILDIFNPLWSQILEKLDGDFYHLPKYLSIEAKRIGAIPEAFLAVDGEKIFFVPYLLRQCDESILPSAIANKFFDVISPYGYPGFLYDREAANDPSFLKAIADELISVFASKNICSAFFRLHPILNRDVLDIFPADTFNFTENGETVAVDLSLSEDRIWANTRSTHRNTIYRCKRNGMIPKIVNANQYLPEFMAIYQENLDRLAAKSSYYFDLDYYLNLLQLENKVHLSVVELEGQVISGSLLLEHDGIVQYHLSGTKNDFLKLSPTTLLLHFVRSWAKIRGNSYFHLGGGLGGAKDGLYNFKAGFSKQRYKFLTLRLITHPENYDKLVDWRSQALNVSTDKLLDSGFFPAYRFG
jgi:Acetyltransferase (GNAT) domain